MLHLSPTKLHVAWNTVSQIIGKVVGSGAMLLVSLLVARSYGVEGYGDFVKITTYVALFYLLADFGANAIYLQKQKRDENLWGVLLGLRLIGSIALVFLSLAILSFLPRGTGQGYTSLVRFGIILFSPAIIFQAIITSTNASFQKYLRYDLSTLSLGIGSLVTLICVWLITFIIAPKIGPVFATLGLLAGLTTTAIVSIVLVRKITTISLSFQRKSMLSLFTASIPLGLTLLFNQLYFRADSFILTITQSTADVGIYGFAYKIFEVALVIPTFFMNAVFPLLLQATSEKQKAISKTLLTLVKKSAAFLLLIAFLLSLILWFAAPLLMYIRPEFFGSITVLRILSLSLPFFFLSSLTMWTMIALGKQKFLVPIYGVSMVLNIVLNLIYIPQYSYVAAAWITVGSEGLVLLISTLVLRKLL